MSTDLLKALKIGVHNFIPYYTAILDPFLASHPFWTGAFYGAIGLYGVYMAYRQEEVNEVIEFIKKHSDQFREEIVNSKEFEKAFLIYFEQYLKNRVEGKRKVLGSILLGFTSSIDKEKYELERLNDALIRMTVPTLNYLLFLKAEIIPSISLIVDSELQKDLYKDSDRSLDWWRLQLMTQRSLWEHIDKWLYDRFDPSTTKVKVDYGVKGDWSPDLLHRAETRNKDERNKAHEAISELVTLGIVDFSINGGTFGGTSAKDYRLTAFGIKFLNFL